MGTEFTALDTDVSKPVYPVRGEACGSPQKRVVWLGQSPGRRASLMGLRPVVLVHLQCRPCQFTIHPAKAARPTEPTMCQHSSADPADAGHGETLRQNVIRKEGAGGRLGRSRPELVAVSFGVNVLGIKGPRKMTAILPRLTDGGTTATGFRPGHCGSNALLDRCAAQHEFAASPSQ